MPRRILYPALLAAVVACAPSRGPAPEACPPEARGMLVDVRSLDPTIRADIRYAAAHNFTGAPLPGYAHARPLLRPEAGAALARVQAALRADGLGLKVFDAYRPVRATLAMVSWAERTNRRWVLDQGYVARQSGHNLGGTVDLTLVRLADGRELDMGTPFDTFSPAAHPANATGQVLENRMRLAHAMQAQGFAPYAQEWWHFRLAGDFQPLDIPHACFGG